MHRISIRTAAALLAVAGIAAAAPAAASATTTGERHAAPPPTLVKSAQTSSKAPAARSSAWGFRVRLWSSTIADPLGAYRLYYYRKCNPRRNVRYLTISDPKWRIYRTYECWAILA